MCEQKVPGHNRWHPDIPIAAEVDPGDEFRVECGEWTDAQIGNNDSANDVRDVSLDRCHILSGGSGRAGRSALPKRAVGAMQHVSEVVAILICCFAVASAKAPHRADPTPPIWKDQVPLMVDGDG